MLYVFNQFDKSFLGIQIEKFLTVFEAFVKTQSNVDIIFLFLLKIISVTKTDDNNRKGR